MSNVEQVIHVWVKKELRSFSPSQTQVNTTKLNKTSQMSFSLSLSPLAQFLLKQINKPARPHTHTYTRKIDTHTHTFKGRVGMRTYIASHKHLEENNNTNKRATKPWPLEAATTGLKL